MRSDKDYRQVHILLVEDDDVDAMGIERSMKNMRLLNPYTRAKDGVEALDLLRRGQIIKPYIILLDLNLPRLNGLDFLHEVRSDPELKDAIIFVLTTSNNEEEIYAAYKENIAGYVVKSTLSQDFNQLLLFLDHYWRVVELPN